MTCGSDGSSSELQTPDGLTELASADAVSLSAEERASAYKVTVAECSAFYRMVVVVSTSFLGGTLFFLERIAPSPARWTLMFLFCGWFFLILSIFLVIGVRRLNIEAGRQYLMQDYDNSDLVQLRARRRTDLAAASLGFGMVGIAVFGTLNFWAAGGRSIALETTHAERFSVKCGTIDSVACSEGRSTVHSSHVHESSRDSATDPAPLDAVHKTVKEAAATARAPAEEVIKR